MRRDDLTDLVAFAIVAEEASFTRAAARLRMSQPALSQAVRNLEDRLNVRLLARTTRSVSTTEAGEILLRSLRPALEDIGNGLAKVGAIGSAPSGTIRLTATRNAIVAVLMPVLPAFLDQHPGVTVEAIADDNLTDIVAGRFDAGIRFGNIVEKDMIAMRVAPDVRRAVVGSPAYFKNTPSPKIPHELSGHPCIGYRMVKSGGLYDWEFQENGRPFRVSVQGPLVFNDSDLMRQSALKGLGIAYLYEDDAEDDIRAGRLIRILEDWCPLLPGYYLYHPSRRQTPPALAALIAALRYGTARV